MDEIKHKDINSQNSENILKNIEDEKDILDKKIYIVKVLSLIDKIESMEQKGDFNKHNINALNFRFSFFSRDYGYTISYNLISNGKILDNLDYLDIMSELRPEFDRFWKLDRDLLGSLDTQEHDFNIDTNLRENILKSFLSDELRVSLFYNELEDEISNTEKPIKKLKL